MGGAAECEADLCGTGLMRLVMTAHGDTNLMEQALHPGAEGFVFEALDRERIAAAVRTVLSEYSALQKNARGLLRLV